MKIAEKYFYKFIYLIFDLYYWVKNFVFKGELEKKHIVFQKEGNQLRLVIKGHGEFVEETQNKIDSFEKKGSEEKYIEFALVEALGGCNYIVISKGEKFVQFWTGRGRLEFDFPIKKGNGNKQYYYHVIGLLADIDFVRDSFVPSPFPTFTGIKPNHTYKIEVEGEITMIKGYFNKMIEQATKFTMKMFGEIYKMKKGNLEIRVG